MLTVISPAKKLDWNAVEGVDATEPRLADEAAELVTVARGYSVNDLQALMGISEKLAKLNVDRFADYDDAPDKADTRPAMFAFAGDTYAGLEARTLEPDAVDWAQKRLRILSGLYGVLRPLDAIQPYRLEMGSKVRTARGKSLYDWWGTSLGKLLKADAEQAGTDTLVNCASVEYFGAVDLEALGLRVVTPVFMEEKAGEAKIVSFYAKKARGAMARYIAMHRLTNAADLTDFDTGGYRYRADMSEADRPVFVRAVQG